MENSTILMSAIDLLVSANLNINENNVKQFDDSDK